MKQQKRHTKSAKQAKDKSKYLSWWFIVPVCAYCLWEMDISRRTLYELEWWWLIVFAIIGFTVGIVRLIKDTEIIWNWKEYLGGVVYSLIHSVGGVIIFLLFYSVIELANYYIPSNRPYYDESATVLNKNYYFGSYRSQTHYDVECQFEKEQIGIQLINDHELYDLSQIGDTIIFTIQNGFFNIPVIKDFSKQ